MAKKLSLYGILISLAFILSYLELLIPLNLPGVKLGLSNVVILIALYLKGYKSAVAISLVRIMLVSFTFGNISTAIYSAAGGILSLIIMLIFKKIGLFSITGVSIVGGVVHNLGQFFCAMFLLSFPLSLSYISFLILAGTLMGAIIGCISLMLVNRLKNYIKNTGIYI